MKKNNSAKYCNIVIIFTLVILVLLSLSMSFAWYQAKEANGIVKNLNTAGIKIDFNTRDSNTLTPDILKEGVLNNTNKLPDEDDYKKRKENNDTYYVESFGNTVNVKEDVKIIFSAYDDGINSGVYNTATFTISMKYLNHEGKVIDLNNFSEYFHIEYAMVTKGYDYTLADYTGKFSVNTAGEYDLHLGISYELPDELLPVDIVNSSCITIYITAELS